MHISYESGILENPSNELRESMFQMTKSPKLAPDVSVRLEICFKKGLPVLVTQEESSYEQPLEILSFLNKVGGDHGVGRIDIVENRFIGLKVGFFEIFSRYIIYFNHFCRILNYCCKMRQFFEYINSAPHNYNFLSIRFKECINILVFNILIKG